MTDNPPIRTYVNKIENIKIKSGYHLKFLTLETMILLESTKNKITKDKNGENVPRLDITVVILDHCNIFNTDYQYYSNVLNTFVPNKSIIRYFTKIFHVFKDKSLNNRVVIY